MPALKIPAPCGTEAPTAQIEHSDGIEAPASTVDASGNRSAILLIVDDDPSVPELIRDFLHADAYRFEIARNGKEAFECFHSQVPDVALVDVVLPDTDGIEVLDLIRREQLDTAVILMTGYSSEARVLAALRHRADEFLRKPFRRQELTDALNRTLELQTTRRRRTAALHALEERVAALGAEAMTDALTCLGNRRCFDQQMVRLAAEAKRDPGVCFALAILDVDDFKSVNDCYGHQAGDDLLRTVAGILQTNVRRADLVARIGGDEFGVLLPDTDAWSAQRLARRLQSSITSSTPATMQPAISVRISVGVADSRTEGDVFRAADRNLYTAKHKRCTLA